MVQLLAEGWLATITSNNDRLPPGSLITRQPNISA
jgi:hypothetical protein